jgi:uncharacterized membrane protein/histidinol-phosphate/aromatic aminotransferase/cobyric acid decarboxylase-like protein
VPASRIVVTAGSSAALLLAFGVLLDAGDEVLLSDPGYPCNRHFVQALGGVPRLVAVGPDTRYQLTAAAARAHWGVRTRVAMVATPSNPTGTLVTPAEIEALAAFAREHDGTLLVDEIYHGLVYDEGAARHTAVAAGEDVIVINSFSKYFQMTGWRLGWMVVPPGLVREIEKLAQNLFISPSTVAQHAALACFEPETLAIVEERRAELDRRRRWLIPRARIPRLHRARRAAGRFLRLCGLLAAHRRQLRLRARRAGPGGRRVHARQGFRAQRPRAPRAHRLHATHRAPRGSARAAREISQPMTLWIDALLAYLHYTAIFLLFAFMTVEVMLMRGDLDARSIRLLTRVDLWYFGSAIAALVTGGLRLALGAKGADFYFSGWPIYAKLALFFAVAIVSIQPTLTFIRWRRAAEHDAAWSVPEDERKRMRRYLMIEVHLAALIPLVAVIMARGLAR